MSSPSTGLKQRNKDKISNVPVETEEKNDLKVEKKENDSVSVDTAHSSVSPVPKPQATKNNTVVFEVIMLLFVYFMLVHVCATLVNHIDDTDEIYGYYEPLHYLLYGEGMQTWEYSPNYAIRSYAFIYPFYWISKFFVYLKIHKIRLFYFIRLTLSVFTATGEVSLISAITKRYSNTLLTSLTVAFLICSTGMFYVSTSFLPSAVSSALLMHCVASWMDMNFYYAIFWGSLAVLWTGWPFVGLLLIPIGCHMLISKAFIRNGMTDISQAGKFLVHAVMFAMLIFIPALIIDSYFYGRL
jgi:alpha-1,2-mannosyltransferase